MSYGGANSEDEVFEVALLELAFFLVFIDDEFSILSSSGHHDILHNYCSNSNSCNELIRKKRGRRKTNDIHEPFCSVPKHMKRGNSDDKNHTYAHKHMAGRDGTRAIIAFEANICGFSSRARGLYCCRKTVTRRELKQARAFLLRLSNSENSKI